MMMMSSRSLAVFVVLLVSKALGAVPPLAVEVRQAQAENIFIGVLEEVNIEEVEQREGVINAVATGKVKVVSTEKGEAADLWTVTYWWPLKRPEGWTGHQGLQSQPPKGVKIRFFATADGELLLPNGWELYEGDADEEEPTFDPTSRPAENVDEIADDIEIIEEKDLPATSEQKDLDSSIDEKEKKEVTAHIPSLLPAWKALVRKVQGFLTSIRNLFRRRNK